VEPSTIAFDDAAALTRTGDVWLFRGRSPADTLIRVATNAPVNHVGMAVVIDDLPPLMWHAELGQSLEDVWAGKHQRGVQLHNLHEAVRTWNDRYNQQAFIRQLHYDVTPTMEDEVLRVIARLDGRPFPSSVSLASRWIRGRARNQASLETLYCAELVATTYQEMGLLVDERPENWYDPGRFWSGDSLELNDGATLGKEIAVVVPPLGDAAGQSEAQLERSRRDAARQWWQANGVRVQNERLGRRLRDLADPAWTSATMARIRPTSETESS
jgi:hypothetical protein